MKLKIVVDSSCGLTKKEAEDRGWYFLPLFLNIDGKEYADGIDISSINFFDICKNESIVSTSCTPPVLIKELLDKLSEPDSYIVIYPISQYLSSQYINILSVANDYENIHVISSKNISIPIVQELVELVTSFKEKEVTIEEGIDIIENKIPRDLNNMILFPKYNDNLVRGGRLSPSAAKIAKLLKIIPVITMKNGKLEKLDKGRVFSKTVVNTTVKTNKILNSKTEDWTIMYGYSNEIDFSIIDEIQSLIKNKKEFIKLFIPCVIAIHTGLEAITLCFLKLKYDVDKYSFDKIKGEC